MFVSDESPYVLRNNEFTVLETKTEVLVRLGFMSFFYIKGSIDKDLMKIQKGLLETR